MAGATPGFITGRAGSLPAQVGDMQAIIADQASRPDAQPPIARRSLDQPNCRMPVDADHPLGLRRLISTKSIVLLRNLLVNSPVIEAGVAMS
jgi:hypothetical protein